jgi:nondiscriminating aspartyl-tRNA synthetase
MININYKRSNYYKLKEELFNLVVNELNLDKLDITDELPLYNKKEILDDLLYNNSDIINEKIFKKNEKIYLFELTPYLLNKNSKENIIYSCGKVKLIDEINQYSFPIYHMLEIHFINKNFDNNLIFLKNTLSKIGYDYCTFNFNNKTEYNKPYYKETWQLVYYDENLKQSIIIATAGIFKDEIKKNSWGISINLDRLAMIINDIPDIRYFWIDSNIRKLDYNLNFHNNTYQITRQFNKEKEDEMMLLLSQYRYFIKNIKKIIKDEIIEFTIVYSSINGLLNMSNLIDIQIGKMLNPKEDYYSNDQIIISNKIKENKEIYKNFFEIRNKICFFLRQYLTKKDFLEVNTPSITISAFESGSNVFEIDYFGKKAYLSQSSQMFLQILNNCSFNQVFTFCTCFRAEKSAQKKRLLEFTMLECVFNLKDYNELIIFSEKIILYLIKKLKVKNLLVPNKIPKINYREAIELLKEYDDKCKNLKKDSKITLKNEKLLRNIIKDKYNSDVYFLIDFPYKVRNYYYYQKNGITQSFDILIRGIEVSSNGILCNNYDILKENIKYNSTNNHYLESFKDVDRKQGGLGIGIERLIYSIYDLNHIRDISPFSVFKGGAIILMGDK